MMWMLGFLSLCVLGLIASGIYLEFRPLSERRNPSHLIRGSIALNLLLFVAAEIGLLFMGMHDVMAETAATAGSGGEVSVGLGLALIGIGIPTALATIGAGIAVGPVGASSLAVIAEKPEMLGRSLIYLGLAEGIAIYGLVVTILLLGKI